jgi:single-strand DNA-binding protein
MNKGIITGRLTRDPELKKTPSGTSVVSFTVAADRRYKNADGTRGTDFIPCVAWKTNAEFVCKYFKKGSKIEIVGSIQSRTWEDADKKNRTSIEINVEEAYFGESSKEGNGSGAAAAQQPATQQPAATRSNGAPAPAAPGYDQDLDTPNFGGEEDLDGLPFDI